MLLFSDSLATALFDGKVLVTIILPPILLLHSLNTFLSYYFRTVQQMKIYSIFTMLTTVLDIVLVSGFVLAGQGIYGAVVALLLSRLVLFLAMFTLMISSIGIKKPEFKDYRSYLAFGVPLVPTILSSWVINSSDRYIITLFLGTAAVGIYSPGYMLGNIVAMFIVPLGCVLPVALSKCHDNNQMDLVETILARAHEILPDHSNPCYLWIISSLQADIICAIHPRDRIAGLYDNSIHSREHAPLWGHFYTGQYHCTQEKDSLSWHYLGAAALLNLGLTLTLVHYMGIIGAAIATLAAFVFVLVFTARYSSRCLSLNIDYAFFLKSIASSSVMSIVILLWAPNASGRYLRRQVFVP